jgi:flagellar biosynthesis/type III secretory pathway protein FliH
MGVVSRGKTPEHLAEACQDDDCPRFPCRIYKQGWRAGYDRGFREGYDDGYAAGYAAGYGAGYSAGAASCG